MNKEISITIDGIQCIGQQDWTILQAAESIGIHIPTICFHSACKANSLCRICVVEVQGSRVLVPACSAKITQDMVVTSNSERVRNARRTILELMVSTVDLSQATEILNVVEEYKADKKRFANAEPRSFPIFDDNPMYIRDYSRCILCWRCVQVCADDAQYTYAINFKGRGYSTTISTFFNKPLMETTCVFCGQCIGVCPTGALKSKKEWLLEQGMDSHSIMQMTSIERKRRTKRQEFKEEPLDVK